MKTIETEQQYRERIDRLADVAVHVDHLGSRPDAMTQEQQWRYHEAASSYVEDAEASDIYHVYHTTGTEHERAFAVRVDRYRVTRESVAAATYHGDPMLSGHYSLEHGHGPVRRDADAWCDTASCRWVRARSTTTTKRRARSKADKVESALAEHTTHDQSERATGRVTRWTAPTLVRSAARVRARVDGDEATSFDALRSDYDRGARGWAQYSSAGHAHRAWRLAREAGDVTAAAILRAVKTAGTWSILEPTPARSLTASQRKDPPCRRSLVDNIDAAHRDFARTAPQRHVVSLVAEYVMAVRHDECDRTTTQRHPQSPRPRPTCPKGFID